MRVEAGFLEQVLAVIRDEAPGVSEDELLAIESRIRRELGGDAHYVASDAAIERVRLHGAIRRAVAGGVSASEAAARFGVSRQTVWRVASGRAGRRTRGSAGIGETARATA